MAILDKKSKIYPAKILVKGSQDTPFDIQNASGTSKFSVNSSGNAAIAGTVAVTGTSAFTGAITATGGVVGNVTGNVTGNVSGTVTVGASGLVPVSTPSGFCNIAPATVTTGTNTTPASGTQFVTSVFIPVNFTVTGIAYLIGGTGGTNKVYAVLYDSTGAVLGNSSLTTGGATVGTASQIQTLALTATYAAKGPGIFYVGISMNGNTARIQTVAAFTQAGIWGGTVAQTHGTVAAITPPTTFTADQAPYVFIY